MSHRNPIRNESDAEIWNRFRDLSPADMKALIDTLDEEIDEIHENLNPLLKLRKEKGEEALSSAQKEYLQEYGQDLWIDHRRRDVLRRMLRQIIYHGRPLAEMKMESTSASEREQFELSPEVEWLLDRLPKSFTFDEFMTAASDHDMQPGKAPDLLRFLLSSDLVERSSSGLDFRKVDA